MQNRAPFMVRTGFLWYMAAAFLCCVAVLTLARPAAAEKQIPATPAQSAMPMLPHLEWLLDSGGTLSVDDLGKPQQQAAFRPLKLQDLPREAGTVWLRFTLAGRPSEVRPATMLLDMGDGVPDTPTLFVPKHNLLTGVTEWQTFSPSQRSVFLMPETRQEPVTAYIRMDGLPGLWFSPMLRTPHDAATALERLARPAVIVALGVIMLLCLLRGLTERGEWRIWTSLYTAAALVHAVWGAPATSKGHVDMMNMVAVLAPGVGLMILPHVGRHLLRTRQMSRAIDVQLFLLSLPGAALALLPLLPGYSWTSRFLDLWPAGTLLLVPTTLGAWLCGLPGARRFLLGCLLPPLGVAVGILGMGTAIPAPVLGTAPLWGLALGALIIAGTAAPAEHRVAEGPVAGAMPTAQDLVDEDPNLRIVSPEELAQGGEAPPAGIISGDSHALALEESLRGPMDDLLRDGAALAQCALPPVARQLADTMVQSVHRMATSLAGGPSHSASSRMREEVIFDLQEVLRQAHDAVSAVADSKNIALSWFMPPHLGQRYRGGVAQLGNVLRLLLESAVRATSRGAVQLAVRRVPESVNPGHLLFSVTDSGSGVPPEDRSSVALARAWELAGANRGFLGVECSPHGATISFTLHLEPAGDMSADAEAVQGLEAVPHPGIIVVEDSPGERQLLAFFLEGLGATVVEARSTEEAVELYMDRPAQLLIFDGDLPPAALHTAVQRVRTFENAEGSTPAMIMGLSSDDAQWEVLRQAGFTHALPKPVTRSGLRSTVCQLLPQCAAQESLTPEMDMSRDLPSLPLLGEAEAAGAVQPAGLGDRGLHMGGTADLSDAVPDTLPNILPDMLPDTRGDDEDIIDTGMPLLNMDPQPVPVSAPAPLPDLLPVQTPVQAPVQTSVQAPARETASFALPDLFPGDAELARPVHTPPVHTPLAHTPVAHAPEHTATMQLLPDMGRDKPVAGGAPVGNAPVDSAPADTHGDSAVSDSGGLELLPAYETPEALRAEPVVSPVTGAAGPVGPATEKSHADYLTSLLDGDDDLLRHGKDGQEGQSGMSGVDLPEEAPEAHMAQAVREGAEEARRVDAPVDSPEPGEPTEPDEPVAAPVVPVMRTGAKVDILTRAKEMIPQAPATPPSPPAAPPLQAFDEVPAGTALFVSDAAPLQEQDASQPPVALSSAPLPDIQPGIQSDVQPDLQSNLQSDPPSDPPLGPQPDTHAAAAAAVEPGIVGVDSVTIHSAASVEWVGEPRPVGTPLAASASASTPLRMEPQEPTPLDDRVEAVATVHAPSEAVEWVGEPRPVGTPSAAAEHAPVQPKAPPVTPAAPVANSGLSSAPSASSTSVASGRGFAPVIGGGITRETAVEWVGEPRPIERPAKTPTVAEPVTASAVEPAPVPDPAPDSARAAASEAQEDFVPLSMHPKDSGENSPRQNGEERSREEKTADRARLTLLPQSTPLMDFIIAEPEPAPKVTSAPQAAPMPAESVKAATPTVASRPVPTVNSSVRINITPSKPVKSEGGAPPSAGVEIKTGTPVRERTDTSVSVGTAVAEASAPASAAPQVDLAPPQTPEAPQTPEPQAALETPDVQDAVDLFDEDAVMFTPGTLGMSGLAGSSGLSGASAPAGAAAGTAVLRASYGSVGEPMPITKPDSPAPSKELPLTRLLDYFDQAVQHARQSFEKKDAEGVHEGASYIARQADKVGLRTLARMARCVADAGKAKDMDAVKDLLPELESTVERNRIALGG